MNVHVQNVAKKLIDKADNKSECWDIIRDIYSLADARALIGYMENYVASSKREVLCGLLRARMQTLEMELEKMGQLTHPNQEREMSTSRFREGQRVLDTEKNKIGTVTGQPRNSLVGVRYDDSVRDPISGFVGSCLVKEENVRFLTSAEWDTVRRREAAAAVPAPAPASASASRPPPTSGAGPSGAAPPKSKAAPPKSTTPVTPLTLSAEDKGLLGDWAVAAQEDLMRRLRARCTKEADASASPSSLSGLPSLSTAVAGHLRDLVTHAGAPWAARVSDAAAQTEAVARSMAELSALRDQVSKGHRGKDMAMQVRAVQTHKVSELEALRDALLATLGTGGGHKFDPNIPRSALTLDKESFASGSFSRVYKGTYHDAPIVAKVFNMGGIAVDALKKNVAKEAALMAKCSFPCVVRSHGVCADFENPADPFVALVMDPYHEGTARDLLEKTGGPLPSADAARILESVAWGLDHLHGLGIVHKDLKVENILIERGEDGRALGVVSDFGLSVDLASASARYNKSGGTVCYQAPEQLKPPRGPDGITRIAITPKADMYAFGVVAWVLATNQEPWEGEDLPGIIQLVADLGKRLIFPAPADEKWAAIQELAKECFSADPNTRPTAQEAAERLKKL